MASKASLSMAARLFVLGVFASIISSAASFAQSNSGTPRIPILENVGTIPVNFEGTDREFAGMGDARRSIETLFPASVRDAHRFRVLDEELVKSLWSTPKGRTELISQFELQAFVSLGVSNRPDTVSLVARLMAPDLRILLQESDTVAPSWLGGASKDDIKSKMEDLVFRLFNRIPVDVSVTSVQGQFVTISGGSDQAVHVGDEITIVRAVVATKHPANGSWLSFNSQTLGRAKVVEVKKYAAVAKLTSLTHEGAVEVGDGAKIPAISGRARFARLAETPMFNDAGKDATIIVPPLYQDGVAPRKVAAAMVNRKPEKTSPAAVQPGEAPSSPSAQASSSEAPPPTEAEANQVPQQETPQPSEGAPAGEALTMAGVVRKMADDIVVKAGAQTWSVSGPVSDSGKFPLWLINTIGADVTRSLLPNIKIGYGGQGGFGQTSKGSYLAYKGHGRIYWEAEFPTFQPLIKTWRAGGLGSVSGISVPTGAFGGGDFVRGGAFAGLSGTLDIVGSNYDWFSELAIVPVNIGRIGFGQKMHSIESAMGWDVLVGAFQSRSARDITWGGQVGFGSDKMTLSNGTRPELSTFQLMALARYQFE